MSDELRASITAAFQYLDGAGFPIPPDVVMSARMKGIVWKAAGDLTAINKRYHDIITKELLAYFNGGIVTGPRNHFRVATTEAFYDVFYLGWADGGQSFPVSPDALEWLQARLSQEFGYIDMLFQEAKELRKDKEFDYFSWITFHADNYTRTLREIYNAARLRAVMAVKDIMVTFGGTDGEKPCKTCQKLKGQRHKISWFVKRNYIPPHGSGLECHAGRYCQHVLIDDNGKEITT